MKDIRFHDIAAGIIIPLGEKCREYSPDITWSQSWEAKTEKAFKDYIEEAYSKLNQGKKIDNLDSRIDRHKISAALALAILDCSPLTPPQPQLKVIDCLPNECLAFKTAMQLVVQIALQDAVERNDESKMEYLKQDFDYPITCDQKSYTLHVYKAFYHAKKERKLDLLILVNLFLCRNHIANSTNNTSH